MNQPSEPAAIFARPSPAPSRRTSLICAGFAFVLALMALLALASVVRAEPTAPAGVSATNVSAPVASAPLGERVVVAARTIRAGHVLRAEDLAARSPLPTDPLGASVETVSQAIGLETRIAIYEGRPIRIGDLGPPTVVRRNQIVTIAFEHGGLSIRTDGRALDDGGLGERIRVMNLDSRRTVTGAVAGPQLVVMK